MKKVGWKNARLADKDIAKEIGHLKEQPGKDIGVAGGPGPARSLSRLGLIDEYKVTVHPVVLGRGKPLFGEMDDRLKLKLIRTRTLRSGGVFLHYETIRRSEVSR